MIKRDILTTYLQTNDSLFYSFMWYHIKNKKAPEAKTALETKAVTTATNFYAFGKVQLSADQDIISFRFTILQGYATGF